MYKLFIKIALRYLSKNKLYSFINIAGLSIGLASFILIMIYVNNERSYDKFEGSENIARVFLDYKTGNTFEPGDAQTYNATGPAFKDAFPEVKEYVRFYKFKKLTFKHQNKIFTENDGSLADAAYFKVFKYPLLKGNPASALSKPNSIVLTKSLANKIFGNVDPMNKSLSVFSENKEAIVTVTGVLEDLPNTHLKTNFLISFKTIQTWDMFYPHDRKPNWNRNNYFTYLQLAENTNFESLQSKIIAHKVEEDEFDERHNIEPLESIHLHSNKPYEAEVNGSVSRVKFLTAIAFIILILSWLNYINLSTTKSLERAKEVGIRKVAGAQRGQLVLQSVVESIILNLISIVLAVAVSYVLLSIYNNATDSALVLNIETIEQLLPILGLVLLGVILASLYPAFLLSGYNPSKALKGKVRATSNGLNIRKGLIITQFVATIVLLVGTIVVTKQINFLQNQPIGTSLNNIVAFSGELLNEQDSIANSKSMAMKNEIKKLPQVKTAMTAQTFAGGGYDDLSSFMGITFPNGEEDGKTVFYNYEINDPEYFNMMNIDFVEGNTFASQLKEDNRNVVINEKMASMIGVASSKDALGKTLKFWGMDWNIIGVIKDYHHFGLKTAVQPILIRNTKVDSYLLVKFNESVASTSGYTTAIAQIKDKWKQKFPNSTFKYTFLDKNFEAQYHQDKQFNSAFNIFTLLAMFIACLGLFGLTSYTCIQRKKEIGVRKVNGATITQIVQLLNKDFVSWLAISFIIAIPIAWYIMNNWLENFAYKTTLSWWVFALAGLVTLAIALLTVSWKSIEAAMSNPVKVLRDE